MPVLVSLRAPRSCQPPVVDLVDGTGLGTPVSCSPNGERAGLSCQHLKPPRMVRVSAVPQMMVVAFIDLKSGLVSLIEGLCTQILYFRFEIIGGLRSHLWLFFVERKNILKTKSS